MAQAKFVDSLCNKSKDKSGADWSAKAWTGSIKGRYTKIQVLDLYFALNSIVLRSTCMPGPGGRNDNQVS